MNYVKSKTIPLIVIVVAAGSLAIYFSANRLNALAPIHNLDGRLTSQSEPAATTKNTRKTQDSEKPKVEPLLKSLGRNSNSEILESSGLGISTFVQDAIWTINDSGQSNELFLLQTDGNLLARFELPDAKNVDWEAMSQFTIDGHSYLLVADVGDNLKNRKDYQLHLFREPDCSKVILPPTELPIKRKVNSTTIGFNYEDGPKNCEAICVDVIAKEIWLVEKVYYDASQKKPPGIYTLPLSLEANATPQVAKRIGDFAPRNVTGMAFSPDGKRLLIRNYLNAHLYSRTEKETWRHVVKKRTPTEVVLPIQRQGEAVCFTPDSSAALLTSEFKRQPIWLVGLKQYFEQTNSTDNTSNTQHDHRQ